MYWVPGAFFQLCRQAAVRDGRNGGVQKRTREREVREFDMGRQGMHADHLPPGRGFRTQQALRVSVNPLHGDTAVEPELLTPRGTHFRPMHSHMEVWGLLTFHPHGCQYRIPKDLFSLHCSSDACSSVRQKANLKCYPCDSSSAEPSSVQYIL